MADELDRLSFFSAPSQKAKPDEGAPPTEPSFFDKPTEDASAQPLNNAPDETLASGTAKNAATTVGKGLAHVPGFAGDVTNLALSAGASALSHMPWEDRPREDIERGWRARLADSAAGRRTDLETQLAQPGLSDYDRNVIKRHIARISANPEGAPPTGEQIYQTQVAPRLGEYTPTTAAGKFGRAAGEAAIPALLMPGMGAAKSAASGATAGVAGHVATEYGGITDPLALLGIGAAGAGIPSATSALTTPVKRLIKPVTQAEKELAAGKGIVKNTSDPEAALAAGKARAGLPDEPLAEATQDPMHAAAQDTIVSTGQPDLTGVLQQRRSAQNLAMLDKLRGLGPIAADPTDVSKGFQAHLDSLNKARDEQAAAVPPGVPANEAGATLRQTVQDAADKFHENLTKLKASIPNMSVWTQDLGNWVREQQKTLAERTMKTKSPLAGELYDLAAQAGDVTNLHDLIDLDQSVTAAMKKANSPMNPDSIGHGQLVELKGRIKQTLDQALENQHKTQQEAVARGELAPDDAIASKLQRERDDWLQQRQQTNAGPSRGTGAAAVAAQPEEGLPGVGGTARPAAEGSPDVAGHQGIPGDAGAAAENLKTFNKGWGLYKDIYGSGDVGDALKTPGIGGNYKVPDAAVAQKAFAPGPKGYDTAQMWLRAGGPEGLANLKDIATGRLQAELKGKPLDQAALDAWKTKHADALRAIDEAGGPPGFSGRFDSVAKATQAVHDFENGAAADFLGLKHPDDVVRQVRDLMNDKESATNVASLVDHVKTLPNGDAIMGGLRRAGSQALENQFRQEGSKLPTEAGGFEPMVGGAQIQKFINERRNTLDALFEPEAVDQMAKVAEQLDRSTAVRTAMTTQHGSQTALRTSRMRDLRRYMDAAMAQDVRNGTMSTFGGLAMWEGMKGIVEAVRGGGPEGLVTAGLMLGINKAWQRAVERAGHKEAATHADIAHLMAQGFANRDVGVALMQKAMNEHGIPNQKAFDQLARSLVGGEAAAQQEQERPERAGGGRVGKPEDAARHLIGLVDKARKMDTEQTKPLLKVNDNAVAHALAAANRNI